MAAVSSGSTSALVATVAGLRSASLERILDVASLQTRVDRKYLLTADQFARLADVLGSDVHALEMGDRRLFSYESAYFDTLDFELYHAHRQGRRLRYKVRTRAYLDSGECMFEVKAKGRRGETVKRRMPHGVELRTIMTPEAERFVTTVLREAYDLSPPVLHPVLTIRYARATLVDLADGARLTCDVGLECADERTRVQGADRVLVESKSVDGRALADRALAELGLRPLSISKYCLGVALLHPELPANPWSRTLRRDFGWQREHRPPEQTHALKITESLVEQPLRSARLVLP